MMKRTFGAWGTLRTLVVVAAMPVAALADITGLVFQDYNGNGQFDTGNTTTIMATDRGIGGVVVTAYGTNNAVCGTTTSATTGTVGSYTLVLTAPAPAGCVGPYRLEFTSLPADFRPSARSTDSAGSGLANNSGSSTQFAPNPSTNVNFAVNIPCDYCENNPTLITSRHVGSGVNTLMAALSFPYFSGIPGTTTPNDAAERVPTDANHGLRITADKIGAVWGSSYAKQKKTLFYSAFQKRHAAYAKVVAANGGTVPDANGHNGSGRIYFQQRPTAADGTPSITTINLLADLETLFPGSTKPAGDNHNSADWDADTPATGSSAFARVGRVGFGDVAVSRDESILYAVSLNDKKIYKVPLAMPVALVTSGVTSVEILSLASVPTTATGCPNNASLIPGAINVNRYNGKVYFGLTCVAVGTTAPVVNDPSRLRAFVYEWDGAATSATQVANFPLNYARQCASQGGSPSVCADAAWLPWSDSLSDVRTDAPFSQTFRPQPWLMNIDFDSSGNMIVGLADRYGHQSGNNASGASTGSVEGVSAGDTLKLAASTTVAGTWSAPPAAEFYTGDNYGTGHQETTLGGLAFVPGANTVVSSSFDSVSPFNSNFRSGGVIWLNNGNGGKDRQYNVYTKDEQASFGKAAGIGDIELLCDPAPIEIGNRVWKDLNGNGIQDPEEPPIAGVTVRLYGPDGSGPDGIPGTADDAAGAGGLIGMAVTDANGEYYFSSATGTNTANTIYGVAALRTNTNGYKLKLDLAADYADPLKLQNLSATKPNAEGNTTNNSTTDVRDSDAVVANAALPSNATTNVPTITFNTGSAGENNHSLDFGVTPVYALGNRIWFDTNGDGILNNGELPIPGVATELLDGAGQKLYRTPAGDLTTVAGTNTPVVATTDAAGYYRFDSLPPGIYAVRVAASNWGTGQPLAGYANSTFAGATAANGAGDPSGTAAANNTDKGIDNPTPATNGITSRPVTLGPGNQPAGDVDAGASGAGTNGPPPGDANDNLTVDFGFNRLTIGNTVWRDDGTGGGTVNNGIKDGTEPGIPGVRVELLDSSNNVIAVATTNGTGQYLFTQTTNGTGVGTGNPIPPGTYTVRIPAGQAALNGVNSSGDPAGVATPLSADNDDNGPGSAPGSLGVTSGPFALAVGTNAGTGAVADNTTATTDQPRVDFGFTPAYSLGNRVWFDTNNDGILGAGEQPVAAVKVELLDSTGAKLYRTAAGVITTVQGTNTPLELPTDAAGYYRFDNLPAAGYQVRVAASNFTPGTGPLAGYGSSTGVTGTTSGTTSTNNNDKGVDSPTPATTGITSGTVTLGAGQQPINDKDAGATGLGDNGGSGDANDNLTVDFGFYKLSVGNTVWLDNGNGGGTANNGTKDGTEPGIPGVKVELYKGGVLVAVTTTDSAGLYMFMQQTDAAGVPSGNPLQPGTDYQVRIPGAQTALTGLSSSADPAGGATPLSADNDDNGTGTSPTTGVTSSANFALGAGTAAGAVANNATGVTDQPRVDFGFVAPYSIGNRVWIDNGGGTPGNANNGVVDAGEPAAPAGVTMQLLDGTGAPLYRTPGGALTTVASGNTLATTTTNGSGYYRFDGLPAGGYQVRIAASNFTGTGPLVGYLGSTGQSSDFTAAGNNRDHGSDGTTPATTGITSGTVNIGGATPPVINEAETGLPGAGANGPNGDAFDNLTVDFGLVPPPLSLGNRVWNDVNNNGILDAGETGIGNATVYLYVDNNNDGVPDGNPIATKATDANGYYLFTGLAPGNYIVGVDPSTLPTVAGQAPFKSSTGQNGSATGPYEGTATPDPDTNVDSDDNGSLNTAPNASGATVPMVLSKPVTLASNSEPVNDTDVGPQPDTAANASSNLTVDFGFFRPASLGDFVWLDKNANGIQEAGETGIPGATVNLYKGGVLIATTTTGANGDYKFDNLVPGTDYEVEFVKPPGYTRSPKDAGGDDTTDSDANVTTGRTGPMALTVGQNKPDVDAGLFFNASLGDRVWYDNNRNGIQDAGELGVVGVQVTLTTPAGGAVTDINGNPVTAVTTDANGNYNFPNLVPGSYVVTFVPSTLPPGYQFTSKGPVGTKDQADSDADPVTGKTETIVLASSENDPSWDAGIFKREIDLVLVKDLAPVAPANGTPWVPGNRVQYTVIVTNKGPDDAQAGWVVSDTLPAGLINPVVDSVTPAAATCAFAANALTCTGTQGIRPDPVVAGINTASLPKQVALTYSAEIGPSAAGALTNVAEVRPNATDPAETIPLAAPATNNRSSKTISLAGVASLGDRVWIDSNGNGTQDSGEPGVPGVTVSLFDTANNLVGTTTTDGNGLYKFTGLTPNASYTVSLSNPVNFATGGPLAGYALTTPNVGNDATDSDATNVAGVPTIAGATTGAAGSDTPTYDFGFVPPASLGDRVWFDTNRDGVQDAGELGVPGVTVTLYDANGNPLRTATTDSNGNYLFTGLTPGVPYSVGFSNLPAGYVFSPQDAGGNDANDSDANPATGRTAPVVLGPGEVRLTVDAGINQPPIAPVSIGNFVWRDSNSNGIQDGGELGVPGVTVTVVRVDGTPVTDPSGAPVPTTTTTDGNGLYGFVNLAPGQYRVTFSTLPAGLVPTTTNALGSVPGNDSNGLTATSTVLTAGQSDLTLDLGLIVPPVVGGLQGTVFLDPNRSGSRDPGETGVPTGTVVQLINPATGVVIATTTTDSAGNYVFNNVPPGTYDVRPVPPPGTVATTLPVQRVTVVSGVTATAPIIGFATPEPIPTLSSLMLLLLAALMTLLAGATQTGSRRSRRQAGM